MTGSAPIYLRFTMLPPAVIRDAASFPTRRSSDLHAMKTYLALILAVACGGTAAAQEGDDFSFARRLAYRDRKSTRLNSSHSQISYAVFCLKKKTTDIGEGVAGDLQAAQEIGPGGI